MKSIRGILKVFCINTIQATGFVRVQTSNSRLDLSAIYMYITRFVVTIKLLMAVVPAPNTVKQAREIVFPEISNMNFTCGAINSSAWGVGFCSYSYV